MSVSRMRGPALALRAGGGKAEAVMASGATSGPRWRAGVSDEVGQLIGGAVVQAGPLPVLDATVRRLVAVLEDASSSTAEAVAMVEQDPEFAAQLLRLRIRRTTRAARPGRRSARRSPPSGGQQLCGCALSAPRSGS